MRVLVTGATGYVGGRLVPRLLDSGHEVHVLVRDPERVRGRAWSADVVVHRGDLLDADGLARLDLPAFDAAYYLVHGMTDAGHGRDDFEASEAQAAENFVASVRARHCIYLGGLQPPTGTARAHLRSRAHVGEVLREGLPTTEFRAGPVIGSGSASFEMVRYLTERLPVMVTPKWVKNRVQPIAVRDVLAYLLAALETGPVGVVDLGGEPVAFGDMMRRYARVRGLRRRRILPTPILAPRLAARWVQFVTPIPNRLAVPLIDGVRTDLLANRTAAREHFPHIHPVDYDDAVALALRRIEADDVETRWTGSGATRPRDGAGYALRDEENRKVETRSIDVDAPQQRVFAVVAGLGGERGWLAWDWAWKARGRLDKLLGGPGLDRGRRSRDLLMPGDAVDFWRVEAVNAPRLVRLRAEMRLPGAAWLEFRVDPDDAAPEERSHLTQTARFEPRGLPGLLYWNALYPAHRWLFRDLVRAVAREAERPPEPEEDEATDAPPTRPGRRWGGRRR